MPQDYSLEELEAERKRRGIKSPMVNNFSMDELEAELAKRNTPPSQDESFLEKTLDVLDTFGAPTRAGALSLVEGKGLSKALEDAYNQFGKNPDTAPTGKDIAAELNVPENYQGVAGFGLDVLLDPTNLIPASAIAKGAKAVGGGVKAIGRLAGATGKIASRGGKRAFVKIGGQLTGIPKTDIDSFIKNYDEIIKSAKKFGPGKEGVEAASQATKIQYKQAIQNTKDALNTKITDALAKASPEKTIDISGLRKSLLDGRLRLDKRSPKDAEALKELNSLLSVVDDFQEAGKVNVSELFKIKEYLSDFAKGAFAKDGQLFRVTNQAQRSAKEGAGVARKLLNLASEDIAKANKTLSAFHKIDERISRSLLKEGAAANSLIAAGRGGRGVRELKALSNLTGTDFLGAAQKLGAQQTLGDAGLSAAQGITEGSGRLLRGSGLGFLVGSLAGNPLVGAAIGGALTSPAALRAAIRSGQISAKSVRAVAGITGKLSDRTLMRVINKVQKNPQAARLLIQGLRVSDIDRSQKDKEK